MLEAKGVMEGLNRENFRKRGKIGIGFDYEKLRNIYFSFQHFFLDISRKSFEDDMELKLK